MSAMSEHYCRLHAEAEAKLTAEWQSLEQLGYARNPIALEDLYFWGRADTRRTNIGSRNSVGEWVARAVWHEYRLGTGQRIVTERRIAFGETWWQR